MKKNKKLYIKIFLVIIVCYSAFTLINQQTTLNQYTKNTEELGKQIEEQKEYNEKLSKKKDDVNSLEYIEQTAREMLDMYYPNERVYVDIGM